MDTVVKILIHEKIHVFQRLYPNHKIIQDYMKSYHKHQLKDDFKLNEPFLRSNPDLDNWIYKDIKTNTIMYSKYSSNKPNGISDTTTNHDMEHPYEKMAYEISYKLI